MILKAIIIDDEPKAIDLLENYCERIPTIQCMKSFRNPIEALQYIDKQQPDVVFLDINMPNLSGIQAAKIIPTKTHIIFTTAYAEYAVESYELNASDYLLKPITFQRFVKAIDKLKPHAITKETSSAKKIIIKSGYQTFQIAPNTILFLKKEGNYMTYQTTSKKILARESIAEALKKLPENFIQVHKSYIVRLESIELFDQNHVEINTIKIPVSKSYKTILKEKLH
ncbi:response regulator transcription factor [Kordia sp.]|uniref:LytR/AlgR family response regulator transcription factor n=1 Tax=Kordia sp. TaxID=1965332 RepID=UPI0025BDA8F8|nr:response regulator transcription factor [Kordia sp.]MCH2196547.1 response regulator transcription factor [Kordia sp.]